MRIHPSSHKPVHPLKVVGYNIRSQMMKKMKMMIVRMKYASHEKVNQASYNQKKRNLPSLRQETKIHWVILQRMSLFTTDQSMNKIHQAPTNQMMRRKSLLLLLIIIQKRNQGPFQLMNMNMMRQVFVIWMWIKQTRISGRPSIGPLSKGNTPSAWTWFQEELMWICLMNMAFLHCLWRQDEVTWISSNFCLNLELMSTGETMRVKPDWSTGSFRKFETNINNFGIGYFIFSAGFRSFKLNNF